MKYLRRKKHTYLPVFGVIKLLKNKSSSDKVFESCQFSIHANWAFLTFVFRLKFNSFPTFA